MARAERVEQERLAALAQAQRQPLKDGGPIPSQLFPGDTVSFTAGMESFFPGKAVGFNVGPIAVTTTLGPGEQAADAYARAVASAYVMFEAEFHQKRAAYFKRLGEVSK